MDGTLWDAVDSYCEVWRETYRRLGVEATLTRPQLMRCMGMPLEKIFSIVSPPSVTDYCSFSRMLRVCEAELMPRLGGRLYPGVDSGLRRLKAEGYPLFMVSNCSPLGLDNFVRFCGFEGLFVDLLSFGMNGLDKAQNISLLRERYSLESPAYVGDIQHDCDDAHSAGAAMVWAAYGFGNCADAEWTAGSFDEVTDFFLTH